MSGSRLAVFHLQRRWFRCSGAIPQPTDAMTSHQNTVATSHGGVVVLFTVAAIAAQAFAKPFVALQVSVQAEAV